MGVAFFGSLKIEQLVLFMGVAFFGSLKSRETEQLWIWLSVGSVCRLRTL